MNYVCEKRGEPPFHRDSGDMFGEFFKEERVSRLPLETYDIHTAGDRTDIRARVRVYGGKHFYLRRLECSDDHYYRMPETITTPEEATAYASVLMRMGEES